MKNANCFRVAKVRTRNLLRWSVLICNTAAILLLHFGPMSVYWSYIMSNKSRRLYVGFTDDIFQRTIEHKEKLFPRSFTAQYIFDMLVHYEEHSNVISAKMREKEIKGWRREKNLKLILAKNPDWADLSLEWQENPGWKLVPEATPRLGRKLPKKS